METKQISCDQKLWFIAQNLKSDSQIFYTINIRQLPYQCRVKELHGRRIQACFHGWVILSNHLDNVVDWSLWNPLTSKFICLPPVFTKEKDHYECCLSSPPEDQGSVFLLLSDKIPTIVFCQLDRKRLKWTEMSYAKQLRSITGEDHCLLERPACCNGKLYALDSKLYAPDSKLYGFVIQVDIVVKGKEVVISLLPFADVPYNGPFNRCPSLNNIDDCYSFLKGSCTELFYIEVRFNDEMRKRIAEVCLFKLDMTSKMWKEMVDLEDAVFFIQLAGGYLACYYNSVVDSELAGYIHVLGECGKVMYSFHVKDRTASVSSLPCLVRESRASAWAMLEWRLEVDHAKEEDKDTEIVVRPVNGELDSTTSESNLLNMPLHILELIMEFCVGVEYMKFRATCKHCCLVTPLIKWINKSRLRSYSLVSPWLMVLDNYQDTITFIDPMFSDRYFIKTPQELKGGYEIYCSRYGWLLMYKNEDVNKSRLVFFNPFTSDIHELPEVKYIESFCFSAPPTSPDCMVVGFTRFGSWHVCIHFVSRSGWFLHTLHFCFDPYSFHFPTFIGRDIYTLCNNKRIEAFKDITDGDYSWELVTDEAPSRYSAQYFLSNCDQHLLLVIVGELGGSVEVFKLDESTQEWAKIDELGNHVIYISNTSCICLEAKSPEMGNKIYFPRLLHDENSKIVFYSFETRKYHTSDDKNFQESFGADFFGTKHLCFPHTWIEPCWS